MSNEEQAPRDPGNHPGPDGSDGPDVVDADAIVLDDGDVSAVALEPELSVSPETLDLQDPALGPAQISRDTAEAASLEDAAAEARAVAAAAEEAGTLVGGPLPATAPTVRAAPDGTAPAGGTAGDTAPGPVGGPYAYPPQGGEPGLGHPGLYPGTDPASIGPAGQGAPTEPRPADDARAAWIPTASDPEDIGAHAAPDRTSAGNSVLPLLLLIGGALVLLGLLAWLLVSLLGGGSDDDRVDPSSLAAGECLADFTEVTEDAVRVDCSEPHNAQLLASEEYPEDAEFPGREQLDLRAEAACATASADVNPDVVTEDLQVTLLRATPTEETWADGDRRVDCFAVIGNSGTVSQSLLNP
ncbi:septum formation family protein [Arthrobacter burdickii]|uniref:Septum formation family protein n=1 Tax=Arthrobacter burdickii TaxID=3035920 RepID=A0ABT8K201_9MICC|nr:septum formation family protein [Arthrobacter burdickii]MDN4610409.1 septum formation family protein [Arthrobacter burdickii]